MTDYNQEYYYLKRDGNPLYPLLGVENGESSSKITLAEEWIERTEPFRLCFSSTKNHGNPSYRIETLSLMQLGFKRTV